MARQGNASPGASRFAMLRARRRRSVSRRIALIAALCLLPIAAAARVSDRAQVNATFAAFVRALGDRDADAGVAVLSAASLDEWRRTRALALDGKRKEVEALPTGRRFAVLALRHAAPPFLAKDGDSEALARRAIEAGLADREGLSRIELGDVVVQGERASGQLFAAGLPSGFRAGFVRESGRWRLDLPMTLDAAGRVVAQAAKASESSEDSVIAGLLFVSSGRRPTAQLWEPLTRGGAKPAAP
jgi:hypothetical protein